MARLKFFPGPLSSKNFNHAFAETCYDVWEAKIRSQDKYPKPQIRPKLHVLDRPRNMLIHRQPLFFCHAQNKTLSDPCKYGTCCNEHIYVFRNPIITYTLRLPFTVWIYMCHMHIYSYIYVFFRRGPNIRVIYIGLPYTVRLYICHVHTYANYVFSLFADVWHFIDLSIDIWYFCTFCAFCLNHICHMYIHLYIYAHIDSIYG
jgi:hypothetical protein